MTPEEEALLRQRIMSMAALQGIPPEAFGGAPMAGQMLSPAPDASSLQMPARMPQPMTRGSATPGTAYQPRPMLMDGDNMAGRSLTELTTRGVSGGPGGAPAPIMPKGDMRAMPGANPLQEAVDAAPGRGAPMPSPGAAMPPAPRSRPQMANPAMAGALPAGAAVAMNSAPRPIPTAGMNYDPATGRIGPAAALNPGATYAPMAAAAFGGAGRQAGGILGGAAQVGQSPAAPNQPAATGGGMSSFLTDGRKAALRDMLLGFAMGAGGGVQGSIAGAGAAMAEGRARREGQAAEGKTREAAIKAGIPEDVVNSLDAKSLMALISDVTRTRLSPPKGAEPTSDMREYQFAVQQGYQGTFTDYQRDMKQAGASSVNVNTGENSFDVANAKNIATRFSDLATQGQAARGNMARIEILNDQLASLPGGFVGGAQRIASDFGIKIGDNASSVEAAQAIINALVPGQRVPGSGTMSDRDLELFQRSLPSLSNTPDGNALILDTMRAMTDYQVASGDIADRVMMGEISKEDGLRMLRELPDPMTAFKQFQTQRKPADELKRKYGLE